MKVLVTGGAGFIASHVVDLYLAQGHDVVVVDNLSTGRIANVNPAAKFYHCDIRDQELETIFQVEQPEVVNHHAAQADVRRSVTEPMYDAEVNVLGSLHLIDLARQYHVKRFIYISSGGAAYGEPEYLPCDEAHPVNPLCPYGATKHAGEHYLYMYEKNYGLPYIVLRYPNVYGPRQDPHGEAGVIAIFTGKFFAGEVPTINGDGEQLRDYVYVADCAQANLMALDPNLPSGIYNLGSGQGKSVNQLYELLKKLTDSELNAVHGPAMLGETRHIYLDARKANRIMGWSQQVSLEEGLKKTVDYIKTMEPVL
jgi:UDP-glucose 4-epimerase